MKSLIPLASLFWAVCIAAQAETKKPNIIFFIVDDYNKEMSSAYTGPKGLTPHMERLAKVPYPQKRVVFVCPKVH